MQSVIQHRGPDDSGSAAAKDWAVFNVRLAIVDRAGGQQPIYSDDGNIGIVYNGELYNYGSLREELTAKGYGFHTASDTEVVLRAFEHFGVDSFRRLNGMFAFCVWNAKEKEFFLVRDQLGIKPLYVYQDPAKILFCSELKGLLACPEVELEPDPLGVQDYLRYRYVQAPYTVIERIRCLDAGTYLQVRNGIAAQFRYWDVDTLESPAERPAQRVLEGLDEHLSGAVHSQLMGEVPIGVLLSGGVDSSAIAHYVRKAGANLTTFNIGFPEVNEFEFSRAVANRLGLKHIEVVTTADELASQFDAVALAVDQPIADPACLPLYRLSQELKQHVTVVLSGEGGDELFAGYPQYTKIDGSPIPSPRQFEAFLRESYYFEDFLDFLADPAIQPTDLRNRKYFTEPDSVLRGMLTFDLKTWLPEDLMMKADKILMAHSLEGRFPFLDMELLRFASSLPDKLKLAPTGQSKWALKELLVSKLPNSVIHRPKMGFTVPLANLLRRLEHTVVESLVAARSTSVAGVLRMDRVEGCIRSFYRTDRDPLRAWTLFNLLYWFTRVLPAYRGAALSPCPGRIRR